MGENISSHTIFNICGKTELLQQRVQENILTVLNDLSQ